MSLEFDCPQCGRKIRAPEALAGQKARCPQCQGVVDVPGAEPLIQATIPVVPVQPSFTPGPAPAAGGRRPCVSCGELIVSGALTCRYCGSSQLPQHAPGRTARVTLTRAEAEQSILPEICMQCGAPAAGRREKQFSWNPGWVYLLLFCGLLPLVIVSLMTTKRIRLRAPFCDEHLNHWQWRTNYTLVSFLALCLLGVGAFAL
jgi:hypothetical protein